MNISDIEYGNRIISKFMMGDTTPNYFTSFDALMEVVHQIESIGENDAHYGIMTSIGTTNIRIGYIEHQYERNDLSSKRTALWECIIKFIENEQQNDNENV